MPSVAFYISGHGFGHAARQIEVINALGARPDAPSIVVRSAAERWLFDRTLRTPVTHVTGACDTGLVQIDSLRLDAGASIGEAARFHRRLPELAEAEAGLLVAHEVRLVITDAPPLGCAAAAYAAIPSVVLSNFTWDWIYQAYPEPLQSAPDLLPAIQNAYRQASAGWRLPLGGGFAAVPDVVDMPFVARRATHSRADARRLLGLPVDRPLVLLSFGGYGVRDLDPFALDCLADYGVVITHRGASGEPEAAIPRAVWSLEERRLYDAGLRYEDLVAAVDVVVTKPGYGIVSECLANATAVVYTSRGRFPEYDVMVAALPRLLRCAYLDQQDLFAGRWKHAIDAALQMAEPPERPSTDGAEWAAARIMEHLRLAGV